MSACRALFVTGTDTSVGKTEIACLILRELRQRGLMAGAYKPACSGVEWDAHQQPFWSDLQRLQAAIQHTGSLDELCPQRFHAPLAPPMAARLEGRQVDVERIDAGLQSWAERVPTLIIEGAGGWLCPLTEDTTFADWVERWKLPVLIVARRGLGTLNHTLLTVESIRRRGLPVVGIVLNQPIAGAVDESAALNASELEARTGIPVLGEVPFGSPISLRRGERAVTIRWEHLTRPLR